MVGYYIQLVKMEGWNAFSRSGGPSWLSKLDLDLGSLLLALGLENSFNVVGGVYILVVNHAYNAAFQAALPTFEKFEADCSWFAAVEYNSVSKFRVSFEFHAEGRMGALEWYYFGDGWLEHVESDVEASQLCCKPFWVGSREFGFGFGCCGIVRHWTIKKNSDVVG
jgi:hypothetical protein